MSNCSAWDGMGRKKSFHGTDFFELSHRTEQFSKFSFYHVMGYVWKIFHPMGWDIFQKFPFILSHGTLFNKIASHGMGLSHPTRSPGTDVLMISTDTYLSLLHFFNILGMERPQTLKLLTFHISVKTAYWQNIIVICHIDRIEEVVSIVHRYIEVTCLIYYLNMNE